MADMRSRYLIVMERALEAYSYRQIDEYFDEVKRDGLTEHGFARLTVNIGTMLAHGRKQELYGRFIEMMSFCCAHMSTDRAANDFSVQEIIACIDLICEKEIVDKCIVNAWREDLKKPIIYNEVAKSPDQLAYNWVLFSATGEFLRMKRGLCPLDMDFIDMQLATQVVHLDENLMYRDAAAHAPVVYDNVSRVLFSILLYYGYDGKYRDLIDKCLRRAGLISLRMQSATGEIASGGRSNQFYHNEAHLAVIFEFEAARHKKEGNLPLASKFKRAASDALAVIERGLSKEPIHHVKNRFPLESKYGCDGYGYFNKYMITAASFLNWARIFCDCEIEAEGEPFTNADAFMLSDDFHMTFLRSGDYSVQIDTNANPDHDASGVCRIHKRGAPSEICLSCAGTATPIYFVDREDCCDVSLAAGMIKSGEPIFKTRGEYEVISCSASDNIAFAALACELDGERLELRVKTSCDGIDITVSGDGEVALMLPVFDFDGEEHTEIACDGIRAEINYHGYKCEYLTSGQIKDTGKIGCTRNGHYRALYAIGNGSVQIHISIEKA